MVCVDYCNGSFALFGACVTEVAGVDHRARREGARHGARSSGPPPAAGEARREGRHGELRAPPFKPALTDCCNRALAQSLGGHTPYPLGEVFDWHLRALRGKAAQPFQPALGGSGP